MAGDQGGAIYSRGPTSLYVSCEAYGNESPQGAFLYVTHVVEGSVPENVHAKSNHALVGSIVQVAASSVLVRDLTFVAGELSGLNKASIVMYSDRDSLLVAEGCMFRGWENSNMTVRNNERATSLVVDHCDFTHTFSTQPVLSSSESVIVNAYIDENTLSNATDPYNLVNKALGCESDICDPRYECIDSSLGIMCECFNDRCGNNGSLSFGVVDFPDEITYSPQSVEFTLGVTKPSDYDTIWEINNNNTRTERMDVIPKSGIISSGNTVKIYVSLTSDPGYSTPMFTLSGPGLENMYLNVS